MLHTWKTLPTPRLCRELSESRTENLVAIGERALQVTDDFSDHRQSKLVWGQGALSESEVRYTKATDYHNH